MVHILRAANHPNDLELLQKAAVYQNDLLRLHSFLHTPQETVITAEKSLLSQEEVEIAPEEPTIEPAGTPTEETQFEEEAEDIEPEEVPQFNAELGKQLETAANMMASDEPKAETPLEDLIPITPYYTVDYFASQGIKIERKVSMEPESQLDQQVKSFTEWLKTMKKLKFQPQTTYTDPLVEVNAKASLNKKEIVTEAMAEVWAKQGNLHMAAQVYAKLMLLHPEKTPYFAARLQELKQIQ
jgi:hypothetical protein